MAFSVLEHACIVESYGKNNYSQRSEVGVDSEKCHEFGEKVAHAPVGDPNILSDT